MLLHVKKLVGEPALRESSGKVDREHGFHSAVIKDQTWEFIPTRGLSTVLRSDQCRSVQISVPKVLLLRSTGRADKLKFELQLGPNATK
jgi:hypothetical protein